VTTGCGVAATLLTTLGGEAGAGAEVLVGAEVLGGGALSELLALDLADALLFATTFAKNAVTFSGAFDSV
jgi:hypothetical protein